METKKKQNEDKNEDKNKDNDFIVAIVELLRLACSEAISEIIKAMEEEE